MIFKSHKIELLWSVPDDEKEIDHLMGVLDVLDDVSKNNSICKLTLKSFGTSK